METEIIIAVSILVVIEGLFMPRLQFSMGHCYLLYGRGIVRKFKQIY